MIGLKNHPCIVGEVTEVTEVSSIPPNINIHKITDESFKIQAYIKIGLLEFTRASDSLLIHLNNSQLSVSNTQCQNILERIKTFNKNLIHHLSMFEISTEYNNTCNNLLSVMNEITRECDKLYKV
jgi:allophanate hydrolase subunit 1